VLKDLPPKTVVTVPIELGARQRASYERARTEGVVRLCEGGDAITITHVLALITRLKQICNRCPESGESAKGKDLAERLEEVVGSGHKALVYSQWVDDHFGLGMLEERLPALRPLRYSGQIEPGERERILHRFRSDPGARVLLLSLRSGGVGLNLQEASYVFHFDRWWNPSAERQAEDRAHRIGQASPVHVYRYVCVDTIEERIDEILEGKQRLFDTVVDDVSLDPGHALTPEELFGLFGLSVPRPRRP